MTTGLATVLATVLGALSLIVCAGGGAAHAACEMGVMAELPVTMLNGRPLVPAKVNGRDVSFVIDSGAFFSLITPPSAAELKLPTTAAPDGFFVTGVNGDAAIELTRVRRFDFRGHRFPTSNSWSAEARSEPAPAV